MIPSHVHPWTRRQKWLIVGTLLVALGALTTVIYTYERYHRGPTDAVFLGTWEMQGMCIDCTVYLTFRADHTVVGVGEDRDMHWPAGGGHWHAGGELLVIRFATEEPTRPWVVRIVDISPDVIRLRRDGKEIRMLRAAGAPNESFNQAMQRTAARCAMTFSITSTLQQQRRAPSPAVADLATR
jgi:hypothetical protein